MCNVKCYSKIKLKYHYKTKHPRMLKCNVCGENVDENWMLESHMMSHNSKKEFKNVNIVVWNFT